MHSFGARKSQVNLEEPIPTFPNNHNFLHKTPHGQRVNSFKERPKSCPTFDRKPPKYFQDAHNQQPKTREKQKRCWESTTQANSQKESQSNQKPSFKRKNTSKDKKTYRKARPTRLSQGFLSLSFQMYFVYNGLYILLRSCNSSLYIQSFVHFVFLLTTLYHLLFLIGSLISPKLLRFVILNGTHFVNGSLWLCIWIIPSNRKPSAIIETYGLTDNAEKLSLLGFSKYGDWTTIWMPIVHWLVFLVLQRNLMSIIFWEHDGGLKPKQLLKYRGFNGTSSLFVILIWECIRPFYLESRNHLLIKGLISFDLETDISRFPGFVVPSMVSIGAAFTLFWWYNFMAIQYAGVAWKEPFRKGTLFFYDCRKLVFSEIY